MSTFLNYFLIMNSYEVVPLLLAALHFHITLPNTKIAIKPTIAKEQQW